MTVLDNIPFALDEEDFLRRVRVPPDSEHALEAREFAKAAAGVARPKAMLDVCYVDKRMDDTVTVRGVTFSSRGLAVILAGIERVFPHVATCGKELDEAGLDEGDFLKQYWLDTAKTIALTAARAELRRYIEHEYMPGALSYIGPGSGDVETWPITEQALLFGLLGDVEKAVGVTLTDSCLMIPNKSVSGLFFPTAVDFHSCQVCRREICPGRRAPFDKELWESFHSNDS